MKKKIVCSLVLLCILLSACGEKTTQMGGIGSEDVSVENVEPEEQSIPHETEIEEEMTQYEEQPTTPTSSLNLVQYDGGFFSLMMPQGWQLATGGQYGEFYYVIQNPQNPGMVIFQYGSLLPFLKSYEEKDFLTQYNLTAAFPDAPVLEDRTAAGFINLIGDCCDFQRNRGVPVSLEPLEKMENVNIRGCENYSGIYASVGGAESIAVADCTVNAEPYQCILSTAVVEPAVIYTMGVDTTFLVLYGTMGVLVPAGTSESDIEQMLSCASSIVFSEEYLQEGIDASNAVMETTTDQIARNSAIFDSINEKWRDYFNQ